MPDSFLTIIFTRFTLAKTASYLCRNKNGVWYYLRRVPANVQKLSGANQIQKSLKTKNRAIAFEKANLLNKAYEHEWANVIGHGIVSDSKYFKAIVRKIQNLKFGYPSYEQLLIKSKFEIIFKRLEALEKIMKMTIRK